MNIGDNLRRARERKGLTQTEVFKRTKINNKTLSRYENGGSEPDLETLKILSALYEVSIDWLTGNPSKENLSVKENKSPYITNNQAKNAAIEAYNRLPPDERKIVDDMIKALASKNK